MLEVNFYDEVDDSLLKFAVIISKADGKCIMAQLSRQKSEIFIMN